MERTVNIKEILPAGLTPEQVDIEKIAAAIRLEGYSANIENSELLTDAPSELIAMIFSNQLQDVLIGSQSVNPAEIL